MKKSVDCFDDDCQCIDCLKEKVANDSQLCTEYLEKSKKDDSIND